MPHAITNQERLYLRELANRQMEYASLPVMEQRKRQWLNLNTGKPACAPVVVETWTFEQDMMPQSVYRCQSPAARGIESVLLRNIREHELLDDDKVVPNFYPVGHNVSIDEFGIPIEARHAPDGNGHSVGFQIAHPIADLEKDFNKLKPVSIQVNRAASVEYCSFVDDVIGDILPVVIEGSPSYIGLTEKVIRLMGMERFFVAMVDQPDMVHQLMRYLTDNQLEILDFFVREKLLTVNNGNQQTGMSSYAFTDELPAQGYNGKNVRLKDIWLWVEAEEMVGVSAAMFREFVLPYVAEVSAKLGLVYYGCCEPLHTFWKDIHAAIPNIRKVSISPWSDQKKMGEFLQNTGIVYSRKPSALFLGIASALDEAAWAAHIHETANAAKGCQLEIIMRDVYRVRDLATVHRAIEIARVEASRI